MSRVLDIIIQARNELGKGLGSANASIKKWSDGVKNQIGRESGLDEIGDILGGRGAAVKGFAQFLDLAEGATAGMEKFFTSIRTGRGTVESLGDALRELPYFGQGMRIGASIRELFTGEAAAARKALLEQENEAIRSESNLKRVRALTEMMNDLRATGRGLDNEIAIGGRTGFNRQRETARREYDEGMRRLQEQNKAAMEKVTTEREREALQMQSRFVENDLGIRLNQELRRIGYEQLREQARQFNDANERQKQIDQLKKEELSRLQSIRSDARSTELAARGNTRGSMIEAFANSFREAMEGEQTDAGREAVSGLFNARARLLAKELAQGAGGSTGTVEAVQISDRFRGHAIAARAEANAARQLEEQRRTRELMQQIMNALGNVIVRPA